MSNMEDLSYGAKSGKRTAQGEKIASGGTCRQNQYFTADGQPY